MITVQKGAELIYDLLTLNFSMYCFRIFDGNIECEPYELHNVSPSTDIKTTEQIYEQV